MRCQLLLSCILMVLGAVVFLSLFFATRPYHDILSNINYYSATATIDNATLSSFFCPSKHCSSCTQAPNNVQSCSDVEDEMSLIDPTTCASNGTNNCPQDTDCGDGYNCCAQACVA